MLPHQGSRLGNEHLGSGAGSKSSSPRVQGTRLHGVGGAASSEEPPLQIMMQGARLTCQQAKLTDQASAKTGKEKLPGESRKASGLRLPGQLSWRCLQPGQRLQEAPVTLENAI